MKKSIRLLALVLVLALCFSSVAFAAVPEELDPQASAYINYKYAYVSGSGSTVKVTFSVTATGPMTKLGASCIYLYEDGALVKTFSPSSYTNMYGYGKTYYGSTVSYSGNEGSTYYAIVTFAAFNANGSGYGQYTTEEHTL